MGYYEKAFSLINPAVTRVVWDEYYLYKRSYTERPGKKKNWWSTLFEYPALKAALLTALLTLLVYVLLEMRRKQRYIPVVVKPKNDSLDFVRTIGRLYYDKGDHKNLCRKMGTYFLEHVRNRYKLPTNILDEEFIKNLQFKTGVEESVIRGIVSFIRYVEDAPAISNRQTRAFIEGSRVNSSRARRRSTDGMRTTGRSRTGTHATSYSKRRFVICNRLHHDQQGLGLWNEGRDAGS